MIEENNNSPIYNSNTNLMSKTKDIEKICNP